MCLHDTSMWMLYGYRGVYSGEGKVKACIGKWESSSGHSTFGKWPCLWLIEHYYFHKHMSSSKEAKQTLKVKILYLLPCEPTYFFPQSEHFML